jgi:hypothetical protein
MMVPLLYLATFAVSLGPLLAGREILIGVLDFLLAPSLRDCVFTAGGPLKLLNAAKNCTLAGIGGAAQARHDNFPSNKSPARGIAAGLSKLR